MPDDLPRPRQALSPAGARELVSHVAVGTTSGLPLDEIFLAVAEDADDRRLRDVAGRIAAELRRGASASQALEQAGDRLPPYLQRALAASTDLGQTAAVLTALSQHEATRLRLRQQVRRALIYPIIVFTLLASVVAGLSVIVVPQFQSIYYDLDLELPELTVFLLDIARAAPWALTGLLIGVLVIVASARVAATARILHWLRTSAPLVGKLWIWSGQHEFASILGALATQRVPLDEALACAAASLRDQNLARSVRIAADKCAGGALLSTSLAESIHFDPALPALVSWGESRGAMPEALEQAAKTFEQELDLQAAFLQRVMPSVLFIGVISTMFFFLMGLMFPLVDLINNLAG